MKNGAKYLGLEIAGNGLKKVDGTGGLELGRTGDRRVGSGRASNNKTNAGKASDAGVGNRGISTSRVGNGEIGDGKRGIIGTQEGSLPSRLMWTLASASSSMVSSQLDTDISFVYNQSSRVI